MRTPILMLLALLAGMGCQSARYVVKESDHGIVAIPADTARYRREAEELMRQHFPEGFSIARQEEVLMDGTAGMSLNAFQTTGPAGTEHAGNMLQQAAVRHNPAQAGRREWRITYFADHPTPPHVESAASDQPTDDSLGESLFQSAGLIDPQSRQN